MIELPWHCRRRPRATRSLPVILVKHKGQRFLDKVLRSYGNSSQDPASQ
jgi:hypothetical protein